MTEGREGGKDGKNLKDNLMAGFPGHRFNLVLD